MIIITGILSGRVHRDRSASVAVIYALLMTTLVYRSLSWENFLKAAAKAVKTTGTILLLIGISRDVRLPHQPLQRRRADRQGDGDDLARTRG